ncbi:cobalt/nickel transport system ATP-binding protein [Balneicella halophila]|uniref:Cobalt/nickel transport system ATP-binding protein n=1 Tax=Balneicella halophila TaxID=1537566 RepID=A0A7L4UQW7_BALHA|nr:ABC transporter ATP-binding protein [Balneicella halophila]PVX52168.1 cobalt/nickel transport system ATP-binding protein [Balneicella halophila]
MESILELKNVCFTYPRSSKGLYNVSVCIPEKQRIAVLGLNGAGKSTLFLTLCGVLKPKSGEYYIDGKQFKFTKKERLLLGKQIGYVFQDPEVQLFAVTVYDDIAFGLQNMGVTESEVKQRVEKYMQFLNITHLKDNAPHELSYGQKKLVAIAGVLVMEPKVVILDEPFAWLDVVQEENMKSMLEKLSPQGMTIVMSTHNLDFAKEWADYGIVLNEGECVEEGEMKQLNIEELIHANH